MEKTEVAKTMEKVVANEPKRRGRRPKKRAGAQIGGELKRPRGRPRNPNKPAATWCSSSICNLLELRYDSDLKHRFEKKDNRSKRIGYEMLAKSLSECMGRSFDKTQVQQKLSQLHFLWTKVDPIEENEVFTPDVIEIMIKFWGPQGQPTYEMADGEFAADVSSSIGGNDADKDVGLPQSQQKSVVAPKKRVRRILSKRLEIEEHASIPEQPLPIATASDLAPTSSLQHQNQPVFDFEALTSGFSSVKDGLLAISSAISGSSSSNLRGDKLDVLIAAVQKQTTAIEDQSKQLAKLIAVLSKRD